MARHTNHAQERENIAANGAISGIHIATVEEGRALFDRQARKTLGISGQEFLQRWDAGVYSQTQDTVEGRKIRRLAMLIPFARRINT